MKSSSRTKLLEKVERITEVPMLVLSIIYVVVALLPDIAPLSKEDLVFLEDILWVIWGVFATDLAVRLLISPLPIRYMMQNWPDVLIVAMPFLRPLRFLRILLVLPRAWRQTRAILRQKTLSFIGLTSVSTVLLSAAFVYLVEKGTSSPINDFSDALWWAITTITTVGYGDMYPVTGFGRGVAVFLMLTGITLFGLLTASVASFFVEDDSPKIDPHVISQIATEQNKIEDALARVSLMGRPHHRFHLAGYRQTLVEKQQQRERQLLMQSKKKRRLFRR